MCVYVFAKDTINLPFYFEMEDKSDFETDKSKVVHTEFSLLGNHVSAQIPRVTWWRHPGLRKLYIMMPILFLGMVLVDSLGNCDD